jgi:hypothetical protein
MKMENCIRAIAGTFILASLILAFVVSGYFIYFTASFPVCVHGVLPDGEDPAQSGPLQGLREKSRSTIHYGGMNIADLRVQMQ